MSIAYNRVILMVLIYAAAAVVFSAWIADDAMITLRQVDMTVAGEGIVWNPGYRVQAFTHPTWFWLLTLGHALTGSLFYMTIAASAICSLGALALYADYCRKRVASVPALVTLVVLPLASTPFLDYLASGLENPLSFLLVSLVITLAAAPSGAARDRAIWAVLALAVLNRQDLALQLGPLAIWLLFRGGVLWQISRASIGILLLLGWFGFATFYFGFALPNTFFAKLGTGLGEAETAAMSALFWRVSWQESAFTLVVIGAGMLAAVFGPTRDRALALGLGLHLFYLDRIGGDFMQGRMLTVDFLIACYLLVPLVARLAPGIARLTAVAVLALSVLQFMALTDYPKDLQGRAVNDERNLYYPIFGMLSPRRDWPAARQAVSPSEWRSHIAILCGFAGSVRMNAADSVHIVDTCALTDPFLSRVPIARLQYPRPGHFLRAVPLAYGDALAAGQADWMPGQTGQLFRDMVLLSSAPLFDKARLDAILRVNTAAHTVDPVPWRDPETAGMPMTSEKGWLTPEASRPALELQPVLRAATS